MNSVEKLNLLRDELFNIEYEFDKENKPSLQVRAAFLNANNALFELCRNLDDFFKEAIK